MKTDDEIEQLLNTGMPDSPSDEHTQGIQDAPGWVLGTGPPPL